MEVLQLGHQLLLLGTGINAVIFALAILGILLKDRRLVVAARTGFYGLLAVVGGSAGCLAYGFVAGLYNNDYIYNYSERFLPLGFKLAGLWAGLDGSLLFWTFLVCGFAAMVALQHRWSARHPTGRRLEPYVYLVLSSVIAFFCLVTWHQDPFGAMGLDQRLRLASGHNIPLDDSGNLLDGSGLNQQLVNYWFVIHPPTLYIGFVAWTVPFAFAMAALLAGELGDYWIRVVRRWSMVAWIFLTSGIILGGLWAYRQLGWGGYWAWDPVENASFLPWCTGTAFLHSVMIQERRDMLKGWNVLLILVTFFLTIVGTWMTRSGVVDSVHAFAGGDIGTWFQAFLFTIAGISLFCFCLRCRQLLGTHSLESVLSREAAFFINNLVLVIIAGVVFFLSFYDRISHDWFGKNLKNQGIYGIVVTPFFAALLFLTAVGPSLGWVKTSTASLRRNLLAPVAATVLFTAGLYAFLAARGLTGTWREVLLPRLEGQHPSAFYPTGLFFALSFFICAMVSSELWRGLKARVTYRREDFLTAFFQLVFRNNRRYGGYLVHVGIAVLTTGIMASSMFKESEELALSVGESARVGPYLITPVEERFVSEPRPGEPYQKDEVLFRVTRAQGALPVAHGEAREAPLAGSGAAGEVVSELWGERRFYPKKGEWIKEVTIDRRLVEDIYVYFAGRDEKGKIVISFHLNPLMVLIYLGWFTMIAGALFAALPIPGSKVGLSE
ncbi:MAG: cytochrome c biogenesis protein CcsA [Planctomycetes bacterium]|nr:cytochrome c biogenesis protein CcsA [Planctomycetota bacterium]